MLLLLLPPLPVMPALPLQLLLFLLLLLYLQELLLSPPELLSPTTGPPGENRWCRELPFASPPAPFEGSADGATLAAGGIGNSASVTSRVDSLSQTFTLSPP